ncbi:flagellar type III secretion system pore protein FliP [Butyrivibrio sp. MC2013]|uniref:flagellar type III secretion system pore protein FliP n=1 Tax=Butyrivibrio sp. MC2013 TaxID=1280686 RepID=UPI00040A794A|nr:flagellar type III secretion system pore protein FliP [Butyrivibrio sp. MC2013]
MTGSNNHNMLKSYLHRAIVSSLIALVCGAFLFIVLPVTAGATEVPTEITDTSISDPTRERESNLTGSQGVRTNINEPGSAQSADDLSELNIANYVTVTYENGNGSISGPLRILITLTLLALAPSLIVMMTSFTRIILVLHFTRTALNTQTAPPNMVMVGLALFLTFYIMQPTILAVYNDAIVPFDNGELTQQEALDAAMEPIREFMYPQTQRKDVELFMEMSGTDWDGTLKGIPTSVLVPSFMISELRTGFIIGFLIYIPFVVIDMVVASVLMSMGMMMLPPTTISMPFKILLFVLADGWNLIIGSVVKTFI